MAIVCAFCGSEYEFDDYGLEHGDDICEDCAYQLYAVINGAQGRELSTAIKYLRPYTVFARTEKAREFLKSVLKNK